MNYKLPNGQSVSFRTLNNTDIEKLDKWLRQLYASHANYTVQMLPVSVQKDFMHEAVEKALVLSTQYGDGRNMLFANAHGTTRFVYAHMNEQDTMSFEQFCEIVFPDGNMDGMETLTDILTQLYPDIRVLTE